MSFFRHPASRVTAATAGVVAATVTALGVAAAASPGAPTAAGTSRTAERHTARGTVVDADRLRTLTAGQAGDLLDEAGFDSSRAAHDVTLYRLVYRTVDVRGRPTVASGLVVLPRTRDRALDVVSYTHGSEVYRGDAPSVSDDAWSLAAPVSYASAGFAAVAPDYLGLGVGPGPHPWMHVPSEVTVSVDLLRAARTFAYPRVLRPGVLATGFSQGASAATGLAKALQAGADPYFRARAVAPISGAYALRDAELPALLRGDLDEFWSTAYTAYLLVAWNRIHHLYDSPQQVFEGEYATTVPGLFDGNHTGRQVGEGLPPSVDALLTEEGRQLLERPDAALTRALRTADATCDDWSAPVPVRLYLATGGDEQVVGANAESCLRDLRAAGVPAILAEVGEVDHVTSNARGTAAAVAWFGALTAR